MARARLTRVLALLFPPAAVLVSAHELYLRNQAELGWTVSVLFPFWATALAAIAVGLLLQCADRRPSARAALWAYDIAGFAFLLWVFLRALPQGAHLARWILDSAAGASVYGLSCVAVVVAAARRESPRRVEPALAVLAVVLSTREAALFAARLEQPPPPPAARDIVAEVGAAGSRALPNIYHLLLDSFPDELLESCLPAGAKETLEGFVRFHMASPMRSTDYVLPAIFTGRWVPENAPDRIREALSGPTSLLSDLRHAGYRTLALVPVYIYEQDRSAVDIMVFHEENAAQTTTARLHAATFRQLWAYSTMPVAMAEPLARKSFLGLDAETFRAAAELHTATSAGPVLSRMTLNRLIELEPRLPDRGRYTLVHLMLPHPPHVLRSDCSSSGGTDTTDLKQQTDCTLRLVTRFLERLRTLGRLEGSIVFIHGDHGPGEAPGASHLDRDASAASLRTMLLVKPAGARGEFRRAEREARLVDIAPTLLALAGLSVERGFDGSSLDEVVATRAARGGARPTPQERRRVTTRRRSPPP